VGEPRLAPELVVERGGLNVLVLRRDMLSQDSEDLAVSHCDAAAVEDGAADLVDGTSRAFGIEAQGTEDIP
jgi:hypothetical protein